MTEEIKNTKKGKDGPLYYLKICLSLLLICSCVAVMLAGINSLTAEKIAENQQKKISDAIIQIFPDLEDMGILDTSFEETNVADVYLVKNKDGSYGYCANVLPKGFGGEMNVMVGVSDIGQVVGVKVVALSETAGLGSRVGENEYLSQFAGKEYEIKLDTDGGVDSISGATISSKALLSGVNSALSVYEEVSAYFGNFNFENGGETNE